MVSNATMCVRQRFHNVFTYGYPDRGREFVSDGHFEGNFLQLWKPWCKVKKLGYRIKTHNA